MSKDSLLQVVRTEPSKYFHCTWIVNTWLTTVRGVCKHYAVTDRQSLMSVSTKTLQLLPHAPQTKQSDCLRTIRTKTSS